MKRPLLVKFLVMSGITLLLMIPISLIDGLIRERSQHRAAALEAIANSSSRAQTITGPVLVVPYSKTVKVWRQPAPDTPHRLVEEQQAGRLYFLPKLYRAEAALTSELRQRGIFEALLYHAETQLNGHFEIPANYGIDTELAAYSFKAPMVVLGISDVRGIGGAIDLSVGGDRLPVAPGTGLDRLRGGVHAELEPALIDPAAPLTFSVKLRLQGTQRLQFAPVGSETSVRVSSDWPHPSFSGLFLPVEHEIGATGFDAHWRTSFYSTNFEEVLQQCLSRGSCDAFSAGSFGVDFVDPTDRYVKTDRAVKYALLFFVLTFAAFYLFEVLKNLRVHPVQYGLIGLALALFYLLLLSLSEHMGFGSAYVGSALACIALIGFYIVHILRSIARALCFSAGLALLYALLYGLLSSEDYALLMGSMLLFVLLAAFMLLTRRLDWYSVSQRAATARDAASTDIAMPLQPICRSTSST